MGQDAFLEGDDEDGREFQPLGRVQGHQRDGAGVLVPAVDRRGERDLGQEVLDRRAGMDLVELAGRRDQLVEVRQPLLAAPLGLGRQVLAIAGLDDASG